MKRILTVVCLILLCAIILCSCNESITGARVDENGHLILTMSDGSELDAGEVKIDQNDGADNQGEEASEEEEKEDYSNPQCLHFVPLSDGTYSVSIGDAINLTKIEIPATYCGKPVSLIPKKGFYNCENLQEIIIPATVKTIEEDAFYNCQKLRTLTFAENSALTVIGQNAFGQCKFQDIEIPASVVKIEPYAFTRCSLLKTIRFEEKSQLQIIGLEVFRGDHNLTSVVIPSGVTFVGSQAFEGCSSLTNVYYEGVINTWRDWGEDELKKATLYCYSEVRPNVAGNYWHYVNGVPTVWPAV